MSLELRPDSASGKIDLLARYPRLGRLVTARWFQPLSMLMLLAPFVLAIVAGFLGTSAGNRNFGIVFVWIVWWAVLMILLVPGLGRVWCTACPIPAPGEWLQRRGILGLPSKLRKGRPWPRRMRNMWVQNAGFLVLAVFSMVILTRPSVSAAVVVALAAIALLTSMLFEKRTFCRYLCPIGGFIGLYSLAAPIELRVRDAQVCVDHRSKDCITGNENGYGCPWMVYPGKLDRNLDCGLCTECLRTCTMGNVVINLRRPGSDLGKPQNGRRLDEAFKALIMLACSIIYPAVLFGPWAQVKEWAALGSATGWIAYAAVFLATALVLVPGLFWLAARSSARRSDCRLPTRQLFNDYSHTLIPLGLAAWIAFSVGFVLTNGSYALATLSDPLGWGWDIFGTGDVGWTPYFSGVAPAIQAAIILIGLVSSFRIGLRVAFRHDPAGSSVARAITPFVGYLSACTLMLLWLYLG